MGGWGLDVDKFEPWSVPPPPREECPTHVVDMCEIGIGSALYCVSRDGSVVVVVVVVVCVVVVDGCGVCVCSWCCQCCSQCWCGCLCCD